MKNMTIYAIVDTVAETVVSVFPAINDENATRMFKQSIEKVGDVTKPDYVLQRTTSSFAYPEIFSDVPLIASDVVTSGKHFVGDNSNE